MTAVASGRTPQRMAALARANQARSDSSRLKAEMRAGELSLPSALRDPRALSVEIGVLLACQPYWGRVTSWRTLRRMMISEHRRVRELTAREVATLSKLAGGGR